MGERKQHPAYCFHVETGPGKSSGKTDPGRIIESFCVKKMSKTLKIILIGVIGLFFSISTLEINVFGYENTFFDTYDSYVQVDNPVLHQVKKADLVSFTFPGITPPPFFSSVVLPPKVEESTLPPCSHKRKLYLVQSSLLI
jgi:hypothetical protein